MKFSNSSTSVKSCLYPLFCNHWPCFLLPPLFWRISQPSGQDQQNGKRTYCQLQPFPFRVKKWIWLFLLMLTSKNLLQVLIITPTQKKVTCFPLPIICILPAERGEDYGAEKLTKIKLARILVTNFDKFHHLSNLFILGFCFVAP